MAPVIEILSFGLLVTAGLTTWLMAVLLRFSDPE